MYDTVGILVISSKFSSRTKWSGMINGIITDRLATTTCIQTHATLHSRYLKICSYGSEPVPTLLLAVSRRARWQESWNRASRFTARKFQAQLTSRLRTLLALTFLQRKQELKWNRKRFFFWFPVFRCSRTHGMCVLVSFIMRINYFWLKAFVVGEMCKAWWDEEQRLSSANSHSFYLYLLFLLSLSLKTLINGSRVSESWCRRGVVSVGRW